MAPSEEAKRLILGSRRNQVQIAGVAQARLITQQTILNAIGEANGFITIPRLYQMRKHPMVRMGLYYNKAPQMRMKWHIECPGRPDIAEGIDYIIRQRWSQYQRVGMSSYEFGYKGAIKQMELGSIDARYEDKQGRERAVWASREVKPMVLGSPVPIPIQYSRVKLNENTGAFEGFYVHLPVPSRSLTDKENVIDARHALWWTQEFLEQDNNWYGFPKTGYVWDYWWSAVYRHRMEDLHFERKADPSLMVSYPEGQDVEVNGRVLPARDIALSMGNDLRGGATVAKPSTVYIDDADRPTAIPMWDASYLTGGDNMGTFSQSSDNLNIMILRGLMVPEQALIEGVQGTGSRATSTVHSDLFVDGLSQDAEVSVDVWNRHIIPDIKTANWGEDAPDARMVVTGFQEADTAFLQGLVEAAFNLDPNALPIKFEEVLKVLRLPVYSPEEQRAREDALMEGEQPPGPPGTPAAPDINQVPMGPEPGAGGVVNASGRYYEPRETIHLHAGEGKTHSLVAPWIQDEGDRRANNIDTLASSIQRLIERTYEEIFDAAVSSVADIELAQDPRRESQRQTAETVTEAATAAAVAAAIAPSTPDAGALSVLLTGASLRIGRLMARVKPRIQDQLASMFYISGKAELQRLGLPQTSWDVGRQDVQNWARERAGELIVTMSRTVVNQHLRPWLAQELPNVAVPGPPGSSSIANLEPAPIQSGTREAADALATPGSFNLLDLAQKMSLKFSGYPRWMAERVVRTEARMGYNQAAGHIWRMSGIQYVRLFDGLGGRSGMTDAACLARNGKVVTIDEFLRIDREEEHPNGTLGAIPLLPVDEAPREIRPELTLTPVATALLSIDVGPHGYLHLAAQRTWRDRVLRRKGHPYDK